MAIFDMFKKFAFFKGRTTEGLQAEDLDFQKWIGAHRNWRQRLIAYIDGSGTETLDEVVVCRDDRCELGQWLHGNGQRFYAGENIFQRLVNDHAAFHQAAGKVISIFKSKGERDARRKLTGDFDLCSVRVIDDLNQLERRVTH